MTSGRSRTCARGSTCGSSTSGCWSRWPRWVRSRRSAIRRRSSSASTTPSRTARRSSVTGSPARGRCSTTWASDGGTLERPLGPATEAPSRERSRWEKELLGLYLSDHPLGDLAAEMGRYVNAWSSDMTEELDQQRIVLGGVITGLRRVITKSKATMGVATLEDLQGSTEVVIFPKTFEETARHLGRRRHPAGRRAGRPQGRGDGAAGRLGLDLGAGAGARPGWLRTGGRGRRARPARPTQRRPRRQRCGRLVTERQWSCQRQWLRQRERQRPSGGPGGGRSGPDAAGRDAGASAARRGARGAARPDGAARVAAARWRRHGHGGRGGAGGRVAGARGTASEPVAATVATRPYPLPPEPIGGPARAALARGARTGRQRRAAVARRHACRADARGDRGHDTGLGGPGPGAPRPVRSGAAGPGRGRLRDAARRSSPTTRATRAWCSTSRPAPGGSRRCSCGSASPTTRTCSPTCSVDWAPW